MRSGFSPCLVLENNLELNMSVSDKRELEHKGEDVSFEIGIFDIDQVRN